jgi:hypothetical protein
MPNPLDWPVVQDEVMMEGETLADIARSYHVGKSTISA